MNIFVLIKTSSEDEDERRLQDDFIKTNVCWVERCQWHRSNVYIGNCKHISNFLLIIDFEQANVCWVHIEKINTFEGKIRYIMRYVVVI